MSTSQTWIRRLNGTGAAVAVLAAFWLLMLASLRDKSLTFDELGHVTAGYTYWRFNDYRLDPENGNLPQRVAALPLLWGGIRFPSLDFDAWYQSDFWPIGTRWFEHMGNDMSSMLLRGRAACGLMAVALGAIVWWWSRRLNGAVGGMLSLILFVLSPTLLANGALMTSDTANALFFLAACLGWWAVLHRITPGRLVASGIIAGGLFVTKASAVLIMPMAAVMLAARLIDGRPLPVDFGLPREIVRRGRQAAAFAGAVLVHALLVIAVIWVFYGFRFSAFSEAQPGRDHMFDTWEQRTDRPLLPALLRPLGLSADQRESISNLLRSRSIATNVWTWDAVNVIPEIESTVLTASQARQLEAERAAPPAGLVAAVLDWIYTRHLLPQSFLFGMVHALGSAQVREAFLNGSYSLHGWFWFFPYTVLVKTPLPVFGVIALAIAAASTRRRLFFRRLYDALPLWTLLVIYWAVILHAQLNIGHRHVLATYPPVFILCGTAADWLGSRSRLMAGALVALVVLLAVDVLSFFPNYLAYFNAIAGGPAQAYRHLVDSSLDWGQDLPGVKHYIEEHPAAGRNYLSYFGATDPDFYRIPARLMYSYVTLIPAPIFPVQLPAEKLDAAKEDILRTNPDLEFAASAYSGDQQIAIFLEKPGNLRLSGGTYFISATLLQTLDFGLDGPWGPWNERYEAAYQHYYSLVRPFLGDDPAARWAAFSQGTIDDWMNIFYSFEQFRFARLAAYLRQREPDDSVGYSILVYKLTDDEVRRATDGPPPPFGDDVVKLLDSSIRPGSR